MNAGEARSRLFGLLGECFTYPDAEFVAAVADGSLAALLATLCDAIDPRLRAGLDLAPLADPALQLEALAVEYTRLFDAGARGTGCPLNGGLQVGPQMKVMEEAVRFYNHFGLTLAEDRKELPDHLTTELEFLHFLSFQEAQAGADEESLRGLQRAQRDFLARHPLAWLPLMRRALAAAQPMCFFIELTRLLERFLESEHRRLAALAGET